MFGTVIEKLTSLFSKHLVVSAFFPLLICAFFNVALLYWTQPGFRTWARASAPTETLTTITTATLLLVALAVLAVILSSLSNVLREAMEGKRWPEPVCRLLVPIQTERLKKIDDQLDRVQRARWRLRHSDDWSAALQRARKDGEGKSASYAGLPLLTELENERREGRLLDAAKLETAKNDLEAALRSSDVDAHEELNRDHERFDELLRYALVRLEREATDLYYRRTADFGDGPVAPTAIGNIANGLSAYGVARYHFNIDVLWSRLQKAMQKDGDFYAVVQDAKSRLDGLVALFWLMLATTAAWLFTLVSLSYSLAPFLVVGILGPAICWIVHQLVVTSYRGFADVVRSSIDLYRFALLRDLRLPLPVWPAEEQQTWDAVTAHIAYAEPPTIKYDHSS